MSVTPISSLGSLPEHGRIRTGVKAGRAMKALDTFRFTSVDKEAIEQLAAKYGGEVRPWSDPKASPPSQWEVISEANAIEVAVQPDSVFAAYELWTGGGLQRQCDGEVCTQWQRGRDDLHRTETECECFKQGMLECRPKTRMNLIFPDIKFAGTWRYESSGQHALHTLPTMLNLVDQLQQLGGGLMKVTMHLVPKEKMKGGQKRKYTVVEVRTGFTVNEIIGGQANFVAEVSSSTNVSPALEQATSPPNEVPAPGLTGETVEHDSDEIVDAELVEDDEEDHQAAGVSSASPQILSRSDAFEQAKASNGQLTAKKVAGGWVVE